MGAGENRYRGSSAIDRVSGLENIKVRGHAPTPESCVGCGASVPTGVEGRCESCEPTLVNGRFPRTTIVLEAARVAAQLRTIAAGIDAMAADPAAHEPHALFRKIRSFRVEASNVLLYGTRAIDQTFHAFELDGLAWSSSAGTRYVAVRGESGAGSLGGFRFRGVEVEVLP